LATLIESGHDAIYTRAPDGTISTWNPGAERLYGYTAAVAVGRSCLMLIPSDCRGELEEKHARLLRGEPVEPFETRRLRKDGQTVFVSIALSPVHDASGQVVGITSIDRDITARKRAEVALAQQAAKQAALAALSQKAVLESDLLSLMNEAVHTVASVLGVEYCKLLELLPEGRELLLRAGVGWREELVGHATVSTGRDSQAGYTLLSGEPVMVEDLRTETRFHAPPLLAAHDAVSGMSCRIAGPAGRSYGVLGAHTAKPRRFSLEDVHFLESVANLLGSVIQRKHLEDGLRASEQRMRAVLETAVDAVITIDRQGVIESVNPAAERMFGYAAAEMVGRNVNMLMPPPYRDEHDGYLARYLATREKRIIGIGREAEGRRKDGTVFPVDLAVSEVDHLGLFTGIIRDNTRRKHLEREIVDIPSLQQRRIGQDLHDTVVQELTGLKLMAESLRTNPMAAPELIERLTQGLQNCQRDLRRIVHGLLPVAVDGEGLMAALADLAARTRKQGAFTCVFDCPKPVVIADNLKATHLYLIANEAVHNAVKHAQPRNIMIALESNDVLELRVSDDGIGLSGQAAESQGFGLRIMRNRAAIIGAQLKIEPAEPTGTVVVCTLPRGIR
jgi:PAS domain S-box-containing protein